MKIPDFFSEFKQGAEYLKFERCKNLADNLGCPFKPYENYIKILDAYLVHNLQYLNNGTPPFNPFKIAENFDVEVEFCEFEHGGYLYHNKDKNRIFAWIGKDSNVKQRFTIAHEIAEKLIGYDTEHKTLLKPPETGTPEREMHEKTCNKIGREILIPSVDIKAKLSYKTPSLKLVREFAGLYEVPLSQFCIKVTDDLGLWDAVIIEESDHLTYKKMESICGDKKMFFFDKKIPVCECDCSHCKEMKAKIEEDIISETFKKIKRNETIGNIYSECWEEENSNWWLIYKLSGKQLTFDNF